MGSILSPDWLMAVGHGLAFRARECILVIAVTFTDKTKKMVTHPSVTMYYSETFLIVRENPSPVGM